jgi:hypothetical protein
MIRRQAPVFGALNNAGSLQSPGRLAAVQRNNVLTSTEQKGRQAAVTERQMQDEA